MFSSVASDVFGVTWSRPEMIAPFDCCGGPMNKTGGLSMNMPNLTGLGCTVGDCGCRPCLS